MCLNDGKHISIERNNGSFYVFHQNIIGKTKSFVEGRDVRSTKLWFFYVIFHVESLADAVRSKIFCTSKQTSNRLKTHLWNLGKSSIWKLLFSHLLSSFLKNFCCFFPNESFSCCQFPLIPIYHHIRPMIVLLRKKDSQTFSHCFKRLIDL